MPLNQKQHQYLDAMGINLWQRKNQTSAGQSHTQPQTANSDSPHLDIALLAKSQLFNDIIQALDVSLGDISLDKNSLNLGWLSWEITADQTLGLADNILRTPDISTLSASSTQKAELWALLAQQA